MLRDIDQNLKLNVNSDDDDLLEDLLVPLLKQSITYDRAVGYFSANIFKIAAEGLSVFVKNKGKIRLIVGNFINIKDYDALNVKPQEKDIFKKTDEELVEYFESINDDLHNFRIDCLSWLVANNQLEIKIAFKKNGIFHAKYGILKDQNNSQVVYSGSGNDTFGAFGLNYEEFNIFRSWNEEGNRRCKDYQKRFEDLWENRNYKTEVKPLSKAPRDYLIKRAEKLDV